MIDTGSGSEGGTGYGLLQEVRAYWEGLRQGGALPQRARIDPRGLERALESVFLLERNAPDMARFRLAGMHLTVLMGMEVRGMPLSALFDEPGRHQLPAILEHVFTGRSIAELSLEGERGPGTPALEGRMLLLPVLGDEGLCDRALGCLVTLGKVGRSPRRFAIASQHAETPRNGCRPTGPSSATRLVTGFAEPRQPFVPAPGERVRRPHLRLVKSDD